MMLSFPLELIAQVTTESETNTVVKFHQSFLAWLTITHSAIRRFNMELLTFLYSLGFGIVVMVIGLSVYVGYIIRYVADFKPALTLHETLTV